MKRHFFSDVAFGAAIGIVAGRTVTVGRGRARFAVAPTVSPNQAGVSFVLLDKPLVRTQVNPVAAFRLVEVLSTDDVLEDASVLFDSPD